MKKTFLVTIGDEITTENELDEINGGKLFSLIYRGTSFRECEISVKEISEEQNCGTPKNTALSLIERMNKAMISWRNHGYEIDRKLSNEIEQYIKENTTRKNT